MKVQRRCDPKKVYEVLNESPTHYIIGRGCYDIALRKTDYEPVQEWVDVTRECYASLIDNTYRIYHRMGDSGKWVGDQHGYRITNANDLSKIKVERKV